MLVPSAVMLALVGVSIALTASGAAGLTLIEPPLSLLTRPSLTMRETPSPALVRVTSGVATPLTKSIEVGETVPAPVLAESVAGPA